MDTIQYRCRRTEQVQLVRMSSDMRHAQISEQKHKMRTADYGISRNVSSGVRYGKWTQGNAVAIQLDSVCLEPCEMQMRRTSGQVTAQVPFGLLSGRRKRSARRAGRRKGLKFGRKRWRVLVERRRVVMIVVSSVFLLEKQDRDCTHTQT